MVVYAQAGNLMMGFNDFGEPERDAHRPISITLADQLCACPLPRLQDLQVAEAAPNP
jgi:hypothetical protein